MKESLSIHEVAILKYRPILKKQQQLKTQVLSLTLFPVGCLQTLLYTTSNVIVWADIGSDNTSTQQACVDNYKPVVCLSSHKPMSEVIESLL